MKCNKDCFNCLYDDCINDDFEPYNSERHKRYYNNHKEQIAERRRKRIEERKNAGLCVYCGKRKISQNSTCGCIDCIQKGKRKITNMRRSKGILPKGSSEYTGMCGICGNFEKLKGHKVCEKCLETCRKNMIYASSFIDREKKKQEHDGFVKLMYANRKCV